VLDRVDGKNESDKGRIEDSYIPFATIEDNSKHKDIRTHHPHMRSKGCHYDNTILEI
jgi:hypothetical protein